MRTALLTFAAIMFVTGAEAAPPFKNPIDESRLRELRAGFILPGGLDVSMAVTTESRIDNQVVLRSVYVLGNSGPSLSLQSRNGSGSLTSLSLGAGQTFEGADGSVALVRQGDSTQFVLDGRQTDIAHLVGGAFGSLASNTANDRSIDVITTVDIDISNASAELLGSSLLRAQDLALSATAETIRR